MFWMSMSPSSGCSMRSIRQRLGGCGTTGGPRSTICYIAPVEQLGVLAALSRWRPRVQIPPGALEEEGKEDCHKESVIPQTRRLGTGEPRWP